MSESATIQQRLSLCGVVLDAYFSRQTQRKQIRLEHYLKPVIQKANDIRIANIQARKTALPQLVKSWKKLKEAQSRKNGDCGHLFNPLSLIPIGETTHSRLLGDLLDPNGSHGQDSRLLHAFLQSIDVPEPTAGNWLISIEEGGVDLCLWRRNPASMIIIENKSNMAVDQPNQLYRYWYENIHRPYPTLDYSLDGVRRAFQIIYLPPTDEKQPAFHSLQRPAYLASLGLPETLAGVGVTIKICSFRDHIAAWLSRCVELAPPDNYRLKAHLHFYQELWT